MMADSTEDLMTEETMTGTRAARKIMMANRLIIEEKTGIKMDTLTGMSIMMVTPVTGEATLLFMDGPRSGSVRLLALAPSAMRRHRIMRILQGVSGRLSRESYILKKRTLPSKLPNRKPITGITAGKRKVTIPR
jgi:hypothetical protein